jgi:DsbC/DsbD-like thiol-disulfide interchange protein
LISFPSAGQGYAPVKWTFGSATDNHNETLLTIKAEIKPGWHLYSQGIKEGGPIPTRFTFEPDDHYVLAGSTVEKGQALKFFDETYEMEITWFTGEVIFLQKIKTNPSLATVRGKVEYMTCNNEICIPDELEFKIAITH